MRIGARAWIIATSSAIAVHFCAALALIHIPDSPATGDAGSGRLIVEFGTVEGGSGLEAAVPAEPSKVPRESPTEIAARPIAETVTAIRIPSQEIASASGHGFPTPQAAPEETRLASLLGKRSRIEPLPPAESVTEAPATTDVATRPQTEVSSSDTPDQEPQTALNSATSTPLSASTVVSENTYLAPVPRESASKTVPMEALAPREAAPKSKGSVTKSQPLPAQVRPASEIRRNHADRKDPRDTVSDAPLSDSVTDSVLKTELSTIVASEAAAPSLKPGSDAAAAAPEDARVVRVVPSVRNFLSKSKPQDAADKSLQDAMASTVALPSTASRAGRPVVENFGKSPNAVGTAGQAALDDYFSAVRVWLEKHKRYPRRSRLRGEEGYVLLRILVTPEGRVTRFTIKEGSGHPRLDREARKIIERAQPLPKMPPRMHQETVELLVPVEFSLR